MINGVTMKILADDYILRALQEDVTSEDVTTNAVMPMPKQGKAQLICKETGIIAGLTIFERVFQLLDSKSEFTGFFQDGDVVKKGDIVGEIKGDMRVLLTGERTSQMKWQKNCRGPKQNCWIPERQLLICVLLKNMLLP